MCLRSGVVILVKTLAESEPIRAETGPNQEDAKGQVACDVRGYVAIWIEMFKILRSNIKYSNSKIL
jgi:hypothetical protein